MNLLKSAAVSLLIAVAAICAYHFLSPKAGERIGFVQMGTLLQDYKGMQDAQQQFKEEMAVASANADTLRFRYERLLAQAQGGKATDQLAYQLAVAEKEYMEYRQRAEAQMAQREQELSGQATEKVNAAVSEYGKANGYRIILGANGSGNLMYGDPADDLTQVILAQLNQQYSLNSPAPAK